MAADPQFIAALEHARRELMENVRKQEELAGLSAQLRQTIAALERTCGIQPTNTLGITDAVVDVLRLSPDRPLEPPEVKRALQEIGYDLSKYRNPLAVIHTTLKRLIESEEAEFVRGGKNGAGYVLARRGR